MELELNRTERAGFDELADTTLFCEETMECIVPDACPDMQRILDTRGTVCLKSKEAGEGRVDIRGVVRACVLYQPDGDAAIRKIEVTIPFVCAADLPGAHPGCQVLVRPRLLCADARMLNPRKVYVRAELAIGVQVCTPCATLCSNGATCKKELGVEQKMVRHKTYMASSVQEKSFTFSDDLSLPGSKPNLAELLHHGVEILCAESKVIGSKLIFKGQAMLSILYRTGDDALTTATFELPFSQIMEMAGGGEEADCELAVMLTDLSCQPDLDDGRTITVSMGMLAQAILREERTMELVADIYSTAFEVAVERQESRFRHLQESGTRRQPIREVLETTVGVKSVVDCRLALGGVTHSWEGGTLQLSADVRATVLYLGEDDCLYTMTRAVSAVCPMEADPSWHCACRCSCQGELYATPTAGGVEVRFPLDFHCRWETTGTMTQIATARLDENCPLDNGKRPSIILKRVEMGEELWDIAKAYFTTTGDIAGANDLTDGTPAQGKLLLIPNRRA